MKCEDVNISVGKLFWRYTLPTIAAMLVNGLYQVVDGIFVGQFVGTAGLAAINAVWPLLGVILGVGMMLGMGAGALSSISKGEGDNAKTSIYMANALWMLLVLGVLCSFIILALGNVTLELQGIGEDVLHHGNEYFEILIFSTIFSMGGVTVPFLLRNDGRPNLATGLMLVGAIINILLDYFLVAQMGFGLKGAAIATGVAQGVVCTIGVSYFFTPKAKIRLNLKEMQFSIKYCRQIAALGLPGFFMYVYMCFVVAIHNWLFIKYSSSTSVGAYAIIGFLLAIYYLIAEGVSGGMQPLISYYHGANNKENVRKSLSLALKVVIASGVAFVITLNLTPEFVVKLFNNSDQELILESIKGVRLHLFAIYLDGFLLIVAGYYQSLGYSLKAMMVSVGNMLIQLPFLYVMPKVLGATGVWTALPVSNITLSILVALMLWLDLKEKNKTPG